MLLSCSSKRIIILMQGSIYIYDEFRCLCIHSNNSSIKRDEVFTIHSRNMHAYGTQHWVPTLQQVCDQPYVSAYSVICMHPPSYSGVDSLINCCHQRQTRLVSRVKGIYICKLTWKQEMLPLSSHQW